MTTLQVIKLVSGRVGVPAQIFLTLKPELCLSLRCLPGGGGCGVDGRRRRDWEAAGWTKGQLEVCL